MPVFNHDFVLTVDEPTSTPRPAPGTDRFGLQIAPNEATTDAAVVLQGSINGTDWVDLAEATVKAPMVSSGGTSKSPVVRYVRVLARLIEGDGAQVAAHVVAK